MPGNVQPIDQESLDSFPGGLFSQLNYSYSRRAILSEYPDGSTQRYSDVETTTRKWRFTQKLTAAARNTLYQFFLSHVGVPFWFQDAASQVQYAGVIISAWQETGVLGRSQVSLEVQEVY